jgi:DNA-binding response OmpR family regulator
MFVEDDPHFAELLSAVFQTSEQIDLRASFKSIEDFVRAQASEAQSGNWYPDVLVMDVMSGADIRFDGATYANSLRSSGVRVGVVLVSSMVLGKIVEVFRNTNPGGWRTLQKTSRLKSEEIISAVLEAEDEMRTK